MAELTDFALIVLLASGGLAVAILVTQVGNHLPIPAPVIFLVGAAVASEARRGGRRRTRAH